VLKFRYRLFFKYIWLCIHMFSYKLIR